MIKMINLPPVWLIGFMAVAWALAQIWAPFGDVLLWPGRLMIAAAVGVMIWSAVAFRRARTTIIPHLNPSNLVETGPYRQSRNPIYAADLVILAGWSLSIGTPLGLILLVPFFLVLQHLFVLPEEGRLTAHLGAPYRDYMARVRRWI